MVQTELTRTVSTTSSNTHVNTHGIAAATQSVVNGGPTESALPEDKVAEAIESEKDDGWDLDPANPRNWSFRKKWTTVGIVSLYTFCSPLASSMMAPGLPEIAMHYHITSPTIVALTLSIFLLSFAIGPLILAPLSELYGRTWVLHIGNLCLLAFSLGCAYAPTTDALIGFRFLSGFAGAASIAIGGGTVGDLFSERDRAPAMALYSLGPLIGPAVGPIAGGFLAQNAPVKWIFITISCVSGLASLIGLPFLRETYAPVIRAKMTHKDNADTEKGRSRWSPAIAIPEGESQWDIMWINLSRPVVMLCTSFICFILSLYMAFLYGIYYLMFTTFADFFASTYGFKPGTGGLAYLGLGVGFIIATLTAARLANTIYHKMAEKNGGVGTPEMRIPAMALGSLAVPIGLFWYGWSAEAKLHWIMPIIGTGIFGFGLMSVYLPITLYLVDSFRYAASATSAAALFRSLLGFAFPLFAKQMFDVMHIGGGNSFLAGVSILLGIPFPIFIYYKGPALRARGNLTR